MGATKVEATPEWFCTSRRCYRAYPSILLRRHASWQFPNLRHDIWVRYRLPLEEAPPGNSQVNLTRIDAPLMERLRNHPERGESNYQTSERFWDAGFGEGYVWLENGEPMCLVWLIAKPYEAARRKLGKWAGMYPRLNPGVGVIEGIYTFRRGLRRRGGAATAMAHAIFQQAEHLGLTELRTHIHCENLAAHRWAARLGWHPFGTIHGYSVDLRGLRRLSFYLHDRGAPRTCASTIAGAGPVRPKDG
jgi:hypothetical protein